MPKPVKFRKGMTLMKAMAMYGLSDKERFECAYPEWQERRPSSTFYADFSVADVYGPKAIRDTYARAFGEWKSNHKMLTELVAALNHKIWYWHELGDTELAELYDGLWKEADGWAMDNLKGEELTYFTMVLD